MIFSRFLRKNKKGNIKKTGSDVTEERKYGWLFGCVIKKQLGLTRMLVT